jgi:hypothetical protein
MRFFLWFSIIHLPKDVNICLWKVSYQQLLFKVPIPTWAHMHVFVSERHTESWAVASRRARIQVIVYFLSVFFFFFFLLSLNLFFLLVLVHAHDLVLLFLVSSHQTFSQLCTKRMSSQVAAQHVVKGLKATTMVPWRKR